MIGCDGCRTSLATDWAPAVLKWEGSGYYDPGVFRGHLCKACKARLQALLKRTIRRFVTKAQH